MMPRGSLGAFKAFAGSRDARLSLPTPERGVETMLRFYAEVRARWDLLTDALIYEWGIFQGASEFCLSLNRHFGEMIYERELDDDGDKVLKDVRSSVLSLGYRFTLSRELVAIGNGSTGCDDLEKLESFERLIRRSKPFRLLKSCEAHEVKLAWMRL
jgi:hypothetical protein